MTENRHLSIAECSTACMRSGLVAILIGALGLWLLGPLAAAVWLDALGQYVGARNNLHFDLQMMESDPCFIELRNGGKISEDSLLSNILSQKCPLTSEGLMREVSLDEIYRINHSLEILGRKPLWDSIEKAQSGFSYPAYKWNMRWYALAAYQPNYSLRQAKQLASLELPDINAAIQYLEPRLILKMPWSPVTLPSSEAAIMLEFGLLFSVGYFYLYWNEASHSRYFLTAGTLFGSATRNRLARNVFLAMLTFPAIASGMLALRLFQDHSALAEIASSEANWRYAAIAILQALVVISLCAGIAMQVRRRSITPNDINTTLVSKTP